MKSSDIQYHKNLSIGSRVVPCGLTDTQTDRKQLIVAFHNIQTLLKTNREDTIHLTLDRLLALNMQRHPWKCFSLYRTDGEQQLRPYLNSKYTLRISRFLVVIRLYSSRSRVPYGTVKKTSKSNTCSINKMR